jgi:cell fate regulator YaaT (PSP1 superfamily)
LTVFGKPRYLGFVNIDEPAQILGKWIVIKTLRGLEMGLLGGALSEVQEAAYRAASLSDANEEHTKGPEPMLQEVEFVQAADGENLKEYGELRAEEEGVLVRSRQILASYKLAMKLVDVEYTMNRKKLFFYFTAEQRIDFRAYVRDLAREFRIRIEMRQIGVRDESKTVCGISPCGRACCCSQWLHSFTPINIRMVKEQNLVLNPTKISGICGRLMCCMAYEYPTYNALWKSLPSPGSKLKTPQGNYALEGVNLKNESVRVKPPEGPEIDVSISEFADFKDAITRGEQWKEEPVAAPRPIFSPRAPVSVRLPSRDGKFKLEKISLEEHIAGRINREPTRNDKQRTGERSKPCEPLSAFDHSRPSAKHAASTASATLRADSGTAEKAGAKAVSARGVAESAQRGKKRGGGPSNEAKHTVRPQPATPRAPAVRKADAGVQRQRGDADLRVDLIDLEDSMTTPQEKTAKYKSRRRRAYPRTKE